MLSCLSQVFVESLIVGAPRQMMLMSSDVQKGPYKSGQPATHLGKIIYPQCKTGVWPPSDWDPALADKSSRLPEERLELEWVYGYDTYVLIDRLYHAEQKGCMHTQNAFQCLQKSMAPLMLTVCQHTSKLRHPVLVIFVPLQAPVYQQQHLGELPGPHCDICSSCVYRL